MTTTSTAAGPSSAGKSPARRNPVARLLAWFVGLFVGLRRFLRQVVSELRKVVRPTRKELLTYTAVVLAFVITIMVITQILDYAFGKLVLVVFGG